MEQTKICRALDQGANRRARKIALKLRYSMRPRIYASFKASRREYPVPVGQKRLDECTRAKRLRFVAETYQDLNFDRPAECEIFAKKKRSGGHRPIARFSGDDHARQWLLAMCLEPFADFHHSQTLLRVGDEGRGLMAARKALLTILENCDDGDVFAQMDVADFFGSISHEMLESRLPFGKGLCRGHVHTGGMTLRETDAICGKMVRESKAARLGIPQGSALSQLVAEMVMSDVLKEVAIATDVRLLTYSDNIGVFGPRSSVVAFMDLAKDAFTRSEAGRFQLKTSSPVGIAVGFRLLGFRFSRAGGSICEHVEEITWSNWLCEMNYRILVADEIDLDRLKSRAARQLERWRYASDYAEIERGILNAITAQEVVLARQDAQDCAAQ